MKIHFFFELLCFFAGGVYAGRAVGVAVRTVWLCGIARATGPVIIAGLLGSVTEGALVVARSSDCGGPSGAPAKAAGSTPANVSNATIATTVGEIHLEFMFIGVSFLSEIPNSRDLKATRRTANWTRPSYS
jgi:hypothetical protein